jgi:DNA-binding CsgD family transcriptional regulator
MSFDTVILLIVGTLASGALISISFLLRAKYNLHFLDIYTYFALVVAGYGLVNWIGPSMLSMTTGADDAGSRNAVYLFIAVAVPIALAKLWLFICLLHAMLEQRLKPKQARTFAVFAAGAILILSATLYSDIRAQDASSSIVFATLFGVLVLAFTFLVVAYFLSLAEAVGNMELRRIARRFGWAYFLGYFIYTIPYYIVYFVDLPWYRIAAPYVYYALHLGPVVFIWQFAQQLDSEGRSRVTRPPNIDSVVSRYSISASERAIMLLLIDGLNNAEIAQELSRSPNTVRNHVYNIYKKLGVKNRVQLKRVCDG